MEEKITKIKTSSDAEWNELRRGYVGGSDAAAAIGLNPYASPYSLWAEKTGKVPGFAGNLATEVGTYLEDFVAKKFEVKTGKKVRKCNFSLLNSKYPFAIANIDREVVGEDAGLEIKTTDSLNLKKFKNGEYPVNYYCQCMHYMAVTGKNRWYLAVLIGNKDFKVFVIERDQDEIDALMAAEAEFWEFVKSNIPPPTDGTQATTEAIKTIYSDSNNDAVDLYCYTADLEQYVALNQQIKGLEKIRDEAANRIKEYMGEAGSGEHDHFKVTWRGSTRRTFDSKRFAKENPEINLEDYYNTSVVRQFKVTEIKGA